MRLASGFGAQMLEVDARIRAGRRLEERRLEEWREEMMRRRRRRLVIWFRSRGVTRLSFGGCKCDEELCQDGSTGTYEYSSRSVRSVVLLSRF